MPKSPYKSQQPIRYLIFSWELYPLYMGGLGVLALSVCKELVKQGHQVTVVTPHDISGLEFEIPIISLYDQTKSYLRKKTTIQGIEEELVYKPKKKKKKTVWPALFSKSKFNKKTKTGYKHDLYPLDLVNSIRAFALASSDWIETNQDDYDLIIGMDWHTQPIHFASKKFLKIPFIPYINSTIMDREPNPLNRPKSILSVEKKGFEIADHIATISTMEKNVITTGYGIDPSKILVINNDDDFEPVFDSFVEIKKDKNVLFIGRIFPQKGLDFLIETASRVVDSDPVVRFIIAGDGIIMPEIMDKVASLELERNVLFTGWISMEEKKKLYSSCDIFVMPSPFEPFGLTALEAIRSGVPVIASINCGFLDVVPSTPTFDYYNIGDFTNTLMFYLNNPSEAKALVTSQQEDLSKHSWSQQVHKLVTLANSITPQLI
jgi:glycogen synthase